MNFLERLQNEVLIGDGATGTMLYSKGVSLQANFEHLNLVRSDLVLELHREYIAAGAKLIETNTFGANRIKLQAIGLEKKLREIVLAGAKLARRAAEGKDVFVAGSIGPVARVKGEERDFSPSEMEEIFREQALLLAEGGVDLLFLETFSDLSQLSAAVVAGKGIGLPVVASMAFSENMRIGGIEAEEAVAAIAAAGASVIGANCGAGPLAILRTIERMGAVTDLPLAALPNSGFPEYVDGRYIYRATPAYFAENALEMARAGANLIGGCCGTTPEHIRETAERLKGIKPVRRQPKAKPVTVREHREAATEKQGFLSKPGPVVTVELDPPKGLDCSKVIAGSKILKEAGADAVNLAENALARVRMGNIALAHRIQDEAGIDVIVHVTCRDRNLLGLQSDLMGASLLGIRHILAVTGDPAAVGGESGASSVFDLNSFGLIKLLTGLNSGVNASGNAIAGRTAFTIGCAFNPNSLKMDVQLGRLEKKIANGARFVQTQPLYDLGRMEEMLAKTAHLPLPILPGILPLVSERNAEFLHNEVPGIVIPDEIRRRMQGKEKEAGVREGLEIAKEFIDAARGKTAGFYIITPFGKYDVAAELVKFIKENE